MSSTRERSGLIWQDDDRVSGAVCFHGTRVPVQHMLDYLNTGQTVEEFCGDYGVPLIQARAVVELTVEGFETLLAKAA